MNPVTLKEYRNRIDNIRFAENAVKKYERRHRVHNYIPGQVTYNLGEYPARFSIRPTEYDYELIKNLAAKGVGLIQVHEEWNDAMRILGADKYTSHDPEGMREFISLCHSFGIKVLPYISSGFFDRRDPDYSVSFTDGRIHELNSSYYRYIQCSPSSPEWNDFLMRKLSSVLDDYEFDGFFNDMGYWSYGGADESGKLAYDPFIDDMLARIYSMAHERGGIVKIHEGGCTVPRGTGKIYDYLWVGECVTEAEELKKAAAFDPYVILCPDFRFLKGQEEEELFAKTIPFMEFVLRVDGRPVTGERADVPGIEYTYNPQNDEKKNFDAVAEWYAAHPDGPHVYSEWSAIPDNTAMREKWFDYLALYKPMVSENSLVYTNVTESTLLKESLPEQMCMSMFVNEKCYLCVSNLGKTEKDIVLSDKWRDRENGAHGCKFKVGAGRIIFLQKEDNTEEGDG